MGVFDTAAVPKLINSMRAARMNKIYFTFSPYK